MHVDALPSQHRDARKSLLIKRRTARRSTSKPGFQSICALSLLGYEAKKEIVIPIPRSDQPHPALIGARIDPGEQVAVLDELAFLEVDADQLSRDGL
jgi:hypothetical protein